MKSVPLPAVLLMFMVGTLAFCGPVQKKTLVLIYQGSSDSIKSEPILFLRDEMCSLIKQGGFPLIVEKDKDVAWIYLNDPEGARDYPGVNFESDYFEVIMDLFPIKLTKKLKNALKKGSKNFITTLGIAYVVEDDEVISRIDYKKFEKFVY